MQSDDKKLKNITAKADAILDQNWMELDKRMGKVLAIGLGDYDESDHKFIRRVFTVVGAELAYRRRMRKDEGVE